MGVLSEKSFCSLSEGTTIERNHTPLSQSREEGQAMPCNSTYSTCTVPSCIRATCSCISYDGYVQAASGQPPTLNSSTESRPQDVSNQYIWTVIAVMGSNLHACMEPGWYSRSRHMYHVI